jgi:hypothetical protein
LEKTGGAVLTGAGKVGTDYYLATLGSGIYKASIPGSGDPTVTPVTEASIPGSTSAEFDIPGNIAGFLQADADTVIGVSTGGHIFYIDPSVNTPDRIQSSGASLGGTYYTGALALMDSPDPQPDTQGGFFDKLLLLGYRGPNSSYRHGYVEVQFNSVTGNHETTRVPGANQPSSIQRESQYSSSLRRYPVTALSVLQNQDPASPSVIFASTTNKGLYSYRDRSDGGWQWNHEE